MKSLINDNNNNPQTNGFNFLRLGKTKLQKSEQLKAKAPRVEGYRLSPSSFWNRKDYQWSHFKLLDQQQGFILMDDFNYGYVDWIDRFARANVSFWWDVSGSVQWNLSRQISILTDQHVFEANSTPCYIWFQPRTPFWPFWIFHAHIHWTFLITYF